MIAVIIISAILFALVVADSAFIIALWVMNKIDKEETKENETRL